MRLRDAESPTLLAVDRATGVAAGLLILFERATDDHLCELRIGYVLAEDCWGRGLATELVGGLVDWARSEPTIGSVSAGVARLNPASARVLVVNGFQPVEGGEDTQEYRRILR